MTTRREAGLFAAALIALAGCDYTASRRVGDERQDGTYRAAMADYSAGRLEAARKGFEKVLRDDPANASARFQLACLLQEDAKDYFAALCNYHEYLQQHPASDKASLARDRTAICERLYAPELAKRMNLTDNASVAAENERLREENESLRQRAETASAKLAEAEARAAELSGEVARLRRLVPAADDTDEAVKMQPVADRELLDDDGAEVDRVKFSEDVKNLLLEERSEKTSAPLPSAEAEKPVAARSDPAAESAPAVPETYEVKEGETLTEIARRFYGRKSDWVRIRDANRATISTDGRVRAGQVITLPR